MLLEIEETTPMLPTGHFSEMFSRSRGHMPTTMLLSFSSAVTLLSSPNRPPYHFVADLELYISHCE